MAAGVLKILLLLAAFCAGCAQLPSQCGGVEIPLTRDDVLITLSPVNCFRCDLTGGGITWQLDGMPIGSTPTTFTNSDSTTSMASNDSSYLILTNPRSLVTPGRAGRVDIFCHDTLNNEIDTRLLSPELADPTFSPQTVNEGGMLRLRCGNNVPNNVGTTEVFNPNGVSVAPVTYEVEDVTRDKAGNYSCVVTAAILPNTTRTVFTTVTIRFQSTFPTVPGQGVNCIVMGDYFVCSAHAGSTVMLNCSVDANPPATVTFSPQGVNTVGNTIVISNFTEAANYSCTATNEGFAPVTRNFRVAVGVQSTFPAVPGEGVNCTVMSDYFICFAHAGATVMLDCNAVANPPATVTFSPQGVNTVGNTIVINNFTEAANYSCTATNEGFDPVTRNFRVAVGVPALVCNDPVFYQGGITVAWSYIHTGGQPLNSVSVSYTFEEGSTVSDPVSVAVSNTEKTMVNVPRLGAGVRYTFTITAVNSIGSSYIMCGPTFLSVGIPATPTFGVLTSGPNPGEVTIQIKTIVSGVSSLSQGFQFNIIPVRDGVKERTRVFVLNDYQSGEFEKITVHDLLGGQSYVLKATAVNLYGTSHTATSPFVTTLPAAHPSSGGSTTGVFGGALGGVLAVVVIISVVIVSVVVVLAYVKVRGKKGETNTEVVYEEAEDYLEPRKSKDDGGRGIMVQECPAYERPGEVGIELEECQAYGKLPNTR